MVSIDRAVIVLPTYNEVANVRPLVTELLRVLDEVKDHQVTLLFVDGNSTDGTAGVVRELMQSHESIVLLTEREKGGIGQAYVTGFLHAISQLKADVVIEFDADLQHPPETIPVLLGEIRDGADFVIGSRRVRGGSYPDHWNPRRLFLSRVGGWVARFLLFFPRPIFFMVTDPTSGLRATRVRDVLDRVPLQDIRARGFGYKIELLHRLSLITRSIKEIPLQFEDRVSGSSKMTDQTAREVFRAAIWCRAHDRWTRQFLKFAAVGASGFVVNALSLELFRGSGLLTGLTETVRIGNETAWSAAVAAELSIVNNYLWNDFWTWRRERVRGFRPFFARAVKFNLAALGAILLQFLGLWAVTATLGDQMIVRQIGLLLTVLLLVVPYNWLMQKRVIWRKREEPSDE